ncbi:MAG: efflux RND transporter periplasmic adaptor subunit [Pseudomonadota bacterium]|nr:efflux RND transporter periplasmic adaptor subunit [Pseudomonadota bacterium]
MSQSVAAVLILAVGVAIGVAADRYWLYRTGDIAVESALDHAQSHLDPSYVCPMHPDMTSAEPGTCPVCGMDLVARVAGAGEKVSDGGLPEVSVSPQFVQNFGVRTARVARRTLSREIEAYGVVSRMAVSRHRDVTPGLPGTLESIADKAVGDPVGQGELLYTLSSPEWVRAQDAYLEAREGGDPGRLGQSEQRLRTLGMSDDQLRTLANSGRVERLIRVLAPKNGAVVGRSGEVGDRVAANTKVFTLGGVSDIPVTAEVFERQVTWVQPGQRATVEIPSLTGLVFDAEVSRLHTEVGFNSRTLPVYLTFRTTNPLIKYGMLADVTVHAAPRENVLAMPREALIRTGSGTRVILALGNGRFRPVEVETGIESGDMVEVLSGLEEGQTVVVSGQFLIDSESNLAAGLEQLHSDAHDHR